MLTKKKIPSSMPRPAKKEMKIINLSDFRYLAQGLKMVYIAGRMNQLMTELTYELSVRN